MKRITSTILFWPFLSLGLAHAGTFHATYNMTDFVTTPLAVREIRLQPVALYGVNGPAIISGDFRSFQVGANGSITVSNLVNGRSYKVSFYGPNIITVFTNSFDTNVSGVVNAADYIAPLIRDAATVAYSQAVADLRFVRSTNGNATNVTIRGLTMPVGAVANYVWTATNTSGAGTWQPVSAATGSNAYNGTFTGNATGLTNTLHDMQWDHGIPRKWRQVARIFATNATENVGMRVGSVGRSGGNYQLYYGGCGNSGNTNYIVLAAGPSLLELARVGRALSPGGAGTWDRGQVNGPHLFADENGTNYLYYFGGVATFFEDPPLNIGVAYSTDGTNFTKHSGNPIISYNSAAWNADTMWSPFVIKNNGTYFLFANASGGGVERVGFYTATSPLGPWTEYAGNPVITNAQITADVSIIKLRDGFLLSAHQVDPDGSLTGIQGVFYWSRNLTNWSIVTQTNYISGLQFPSTAAPQSPRIFNDGGLKMIYDNGFDVFLAVPIDYENLDGSLTTNLSAANLAPGGTFPAVNGANVTNLAFVGLTNVAMVGHGTNSFQVINSGTRNLDGVWSWNATRRAYTNTSGALPTTGAVADNFLADPPNFHMTFTNATAGLGAPIATTSFVSLSNNILDWVDDFTDSIPGMYAWWAPAITKPEVAIQGRLHNLRLPTDKGGTHDIQYESGYLTDGPSVIVTLPDVRTNAGRVFFVKAGSGSGGQVFATGSDTIDGAANPVTLSPFDGVLLQAIGGSWQVIARFSYNGSNLTNIQEQALVYPAANPAAGLVLTSTSSNTAAWTADASGLTNLNPSALNNTLTGITNTEWVTLNKETSWSASGTFEGDPFDTWFGASALAAPTWGSAPAWSPRTTLSCIADNIYRWNSTFITTKHFGGKTNFVLTHYFITTNSSIQIINMYLTYVSFDNLVRFQTNVGGTFHDSWNGFGAGNNGTNWNVTMPFALIPQATNGTLDFSMQVDRAAGATDTNSVWWRASRIQAYNP